MPSRRQRRRDAKAQRHAHPPARSSATLIVRGATTVERLAYTRTQAAEALGVSRSTFDRRVLPLLETVEMPWGAKLIPVDELHRLITERRRPVSAPPAAEAWPSHGSRRERSYSRTTAGLYWSPDRVRIAPLVIPARKGSATSRSVCRVPASRTQDARHGEAVADLHLVSLVLHSNVD